MAQVLPREIDYTPPKSLPESTMSQSMVSSPSNGSVFGPSSIIQLDLVNRGYLVPSSMYIRYKMTFTGQAANSTLITGAAVRGTPVYTFLSRLETQVGSQTVESIANYGQLNNLLVNSKMNYSSKVGVAYAFGYNLQSGAAGGFDNAVSAPNGGYITGVSGASVFYAAPLNCILANADRLVPLKFMPSVRIQLTTETLLNAIKADSVTALNTPTTYSISNFELCYDIVEFSPLVDQAITQRSGGMIVIKSQSFLSSGTTIPAGLLGSAEFVYNQRLASIKSCYLHLSGVDATKLNLFFDSVDVTSSNGDYQIFIAGSPYPQRALSTVLNKAGIFMELSAAYGPAHDLLSTQFSINPTEFNYINTGGAGVGTTTINQMGKFYPSVNCEKLSTNDVLLTGVSSQSSPISVRISTGTATGSAQVCQLICQFDALLSIDLAARSLTVMQ
jgi:hypothetical protein